MASIPLLQLAHARSGDKGDTANVGVIAYEAEHYPILREALTPTAVKQWFGSLVQGEVERFELPNLLALNFLLHGALDGGGAVEIPAGSQFEINGSAQKDLRNRIIQLAGTAIWSKLLPFCWVIAASTL